MSTQPVWKQFHLQTQRIPMTARSNLTESQWLTIKHTNANLRSSMQTSQLIYLQIRKAYMPCADANPTETQKRG